MEEEIEMLLLYKDDWNPGPWQEEPDIKVWNCEGYACCVIRLQEGHLSGYVKIPDNHPMASGLDEIHETVSVHNGITWSGEAPVQLKKWNASQYGSWYIGFECNGRRDYIPNQSQWRPNLGLGGYGQIYRDMAFVIEQTEHLAFELWLKKFSRRTQDMVE